VATHQIASPARKGYRKRIDRATPEYEAMSKLTPEEQNILEAYEAGEFEPVENMDEEIERYRSYAARAFKKDKRINIRISSRDLEAIQKRALEEGLPYQTLIASILHKYASGTLGGSGR